MKISNCDTDLPSLDAGGKDGLTRPIAPTSLHHCSCLQADWAHGRNGYAATSQIKAQQIQSVTLDSKPQAFVPPMMQ
ncbi:hypothetical protein TNCV_1126561 [Trichonephila clavipes]|nr:hypothetical protein TNCV_1126561 [Trichonephila clavipes]